MSRQAFAAYEGAFSLARSWEASARALDARRTIVGRSTEGRALLRYEFGKREAPVVFLSSLMHGIELIGSLALLDFVRWLHQSGESLARGILARARLVAFPIVNPDAFYANIARLARGAKAWQRCNGAGVDLNRNFPKLTRRRFLNPLSGSNLRWSPHYHGPAPLSEPESRALADAARRDRPLLSIAFHSFGNLVLYPWAYTSQPNPRRGRYEALGHVLRAAQPLFPYRVRQSRAFYPVVGDMDDWLDDEIGTLAVTIEVGCFGVGLSEPARITNPFCWMNEPDASRAVANLTPGIAALLGAALGITEVAAPPRRDPARPPYGVGLEIAAK